MDARECLRKMRNLRDGVVENNTNKPNNNQPKKDMSMRDMLKITRGVVGNSNTNKPKGSINENNIIRMKRLINESDVEKIDINQDGNKESKLIDTSINSKKTDFDQKKEEDKFRAALSGYKVNVFFEPIEILNNSVIWNGTIDNQLQWSYLVTPDQTVNGAKFNYSKNFDDSNPENEQMVDAIKNYYDEFFNYWRDNEIYN